LKIDYNEMKRKYEEIVSKFDSKELALKQNSSSVDEVNKELKDAKKEIQRLTSEEMRKVEDLEHKAKKIVALQEEVEGR